MGIKPIFIGLLISGAHYFIQFAEKKWRLKEKRINEHVGILFIIALFLVPLLYQIISYDFKR